MKFTTKISLALLIGIGFLYTACKKDQSATTSTTTTTAQNGQIAVNLYKALAGQYGGASINDGVNAPSTLSVHNGGKVLQSVNKLCGFTIDTTYKNVTTLHDTTVSSSGLFKFVYTCAGGNVNGYTLKDSIATILSGATFSDANIVAQNYTSVAIGTSLKTFLVNGSIYAVNTNTSTGTPKVSILLVQKYTLSSLVVDNTTAIADIKSGTATYIVNSNNNGAVQSLTGTITFVGNHTAILVINGGGKYSVNLLTGVTTKL